MLGREIGISGVLTKTCEKCDGSGDIENVRELRLEELSDAQVKALLHADVYRESGGEEAQKEAQRAKRMQRSQSSSRPNARPTNKAGRSALGSGPSATTPHIS